MRTLNFHTMEIMSALEDAFKNPFPNDSRRWHTYQKRLRRSAEQISSLNPKASMEIERAKILGILSELDHDLKHFEPKEQELTAAP